MKTIIVAGDVSIDWLDCPLAPQDALDAAGRPTANWRRYQGHKLIARGGGALLLARFVESAVGPKGQVVTHALKDLENASSQDVIYSLTELAKIERDKKALSDRPYSWRCRKFHGYSGPHVGNPKRFPMTAKPTKADVLVLSDTGNGFRDQDDEDAWPTIIGKIPSDTWVVYKMHTPLCQGALWETVYEQDIRRLVVIVRADDLRGAGMKISRQMSWERTAADFMVSIKSTQDPALKALATCPHVIVQFGLEGAIHFQGRPEQRRPRGRNGARAGRHAAAKPLTAKLYFDPTEIEDGFSESFRGKMAGYGSALAAGLVKKLIDFGDQNAAFDGAAVGEGVEFGLKCARQLLIDGFLEDNGDLNYPGASLFEHAARQTGIAAATIPSIGDDCAQYITDGESWTILSEQRALGLEQVAREYVRNGTSSVLSQVPMGRFGEFVTYDRREIEAFQCIRNVMREYMSRPAAKRPLSIAVFGPPGSGKSFGVQQIAESIGRDQSRAVKKIEVNVSQLRTPADLNAEWHKVRDCVLNGTLPLVFFDEFDSPLDTRPLGWLKCFLAPMQDGEFREGEAVHPIGQSILVFAGGTRDDFKSFYPTVVTDPSAVLKIDDEPSKKPHDSFREAKGTDFVSRLRGYVDIRSSNADTTDPFFRLRRAMVIRSFLKKHAPDVFDHNNRVSIDDAVLRALLNISRYRHGVRSIEAVIETSLLRGRKSFGQSYLPAAEQLNLYFDSKEFSDWLGGEVTLAEQLEEIARAVHEQFRRDNEDKPANDPSVQPWKSLAETFKQSNRGAAAHIAVKLGTLGYGCIYHGGAVKQTVRLDVSEIEKMAVIEHQRWCDERIGDGWRWGEVKDPIEKTHPDLVDWSELEEKAKEKDRKQVRAIPDILSKAGFLIVRNIGNGKKGQGRGDAAKARGKSSRDKSPSKNGKRTSRRR